ncbi:hypothetical protein [Dactylosporangium sp. NPDC049140]|uniref:hypothetical protein n=1 Tax=Dactylosporangium sp. NPDC049140 TaxID=3155647 RepID=UPI00341049D2
MIAHAGAAGGGAHRTGIRRLVAMLLPLVSVLLMTSRPAGAEPSPVPSAGVPQPSQPAATPGVPAPSAVDNPRCGGTVPATVQRWCVLLARYTTSPPQGAPSHWMTACEQALTTEQQLACQTVALTLDDRLRDGTPTVLSDVASGAASSPELVRCDLFVQRAAADTANATRWTSKRDRCAAAARTLSLQLRDPGGSTAPPSTPPADGARDDGCGLTDVSCQVQHVLNSAVATGIQGLVTMVVQTMAWLLSEVAKLVFTATAPPPPDEAFYFTYNSTASILLLFLLLFFIVSTIINGLRVNGPGPVATLGGLVRALLGICFAGGLAWVIVAAWDEATNALITNNEHERWDPSAWVTAVSALSAGAGTTLVALLIAGLSIIGLLLVGITQLFRSELAEGAALLGAFAMTGQVSAETKHWGRRWFWTLNALGASRFVTVEFWIYGTRAAYESDLITALKGLLIIWMMVMTPWVLLRLMSIFDGYLSDINARGVLAAAGSYAAQAADSMPGSSFSSGDGGQSVAELMQGNLADLASPGGGAGQGGRQAGGGDLQQRLGLRDGPDRQAADAVSTAGDGTPVGDPSTTDGPAAAGPASGEHPNADEATGVQQSSRQAQADVHAATTITGGESSATGAATGGGADPLLAAASADQRPATGAPQPSDGGGGVPAADSPDHAAGGGGASSPGGGAGGATPGGGAGGAAAGVAEVPIVPV